MIAPDLAFSLVNRFKPDNKSTFIILKDQISFRVIEFLINTSIPITLENNMLTFRDSNKSFKLHGDLMKTMTKHNIDVGHSNPEVQKITYEFGREMKFIFQQVGRKNPRDESLIKLLKLPAVMPSGNSTIFLPTNPDELCDIINLLQQEKQAGNISIIIIPKKSLL